MVAVKYLGLPNPRQTFADLKPYRTELIHMQMSYRPFGEDYKVIAAAIEALDAAALRFVGPDAVRDLYASKDAAALGQRGPK